MENRSGCANDHSYSGHSFLARGQYIYNIFGDEGMMYLRFSAISMGLDAVVVAMSDLEDWDSKGTEESSIGV